MNKLGAFSILIGAAAAGYFFWKSEQTPPAPPVPEIEPAEFCRKLRKMLSERDFPKSKHGDLMLSCFRTGPAPQTNTPSVFVSLFHNLLDDEKAASIATDSIKRLTKEHGNAVFLSGSELLDAGNCLGYEIKDGESKPHRGCRFLK